MAVKKTAKAKAVAKKSTTGARRGRPPGSKNKTGPATKKVSAPAKKKNAKPGSGRGGANRPVNEETGFVEGTDQDVIASCLLEGGESRQEIAERVESLIETETRNGTDKQIVNMISGVLSKLLARGYTVEQSFQVVPPTPASKRAAAKKAAAKPAPAKKTASKKTTGAKRGRPVGSKNKTAAKKGKK
jgi:hypothetical protein